MWVVAVLGVLAIGTAAGLAAVRGNPDGELPSFPPGTTMARIAAAGELRVGVKLDQPLWSIADPEGRPSGFDVEIARIVAAGLGVRQENVEFVTVAADEREQALLDDEVDVVVATYAMTDARRQQVSFAGPYATTGQDLLIREDEDRITGPESLRDPELQVCAMTGQPPAQEITRWSSRVVLKDIYSTCADQLMIDQLDAVTAEATILAGFAQGIPGTRVVGNRFTTQDYGIGIRRGDTGFCGFINDTLAAAAADGRYEAAWANTAGRYDPTPATLPPPAPCT